MCEFIRTMQGIDLNLLSNIDLEKDPKFLRTEKCWVGTSFRMAFLAEKVNIAKDEREKMALLVSTNFWSPTPLLFMIKQQKTKNLELFFLFYRKRSALKCFYKSLDLYVL